MQRVHYRIDNIAPATGGPRPRVQCAPEDADLVCSLLPDGRHAPVLDIDMPATLYACPNGTSVLRVRGSGNSKEILAFLEGGIAAGFLHARSRGKPS